ncbi:MAG: hypothetical protein M1357_00360 [Candidatus Marsarchaeota archaeon]|nr:hypothetical protein [Candidatus Marsarchaeota archaeon]
MQDKEESLKPPFLRPPTQDEWLEINDELRSLDASLPSHYHALIHALKYRELMIFASEETYELSRKLGAARNVYSAGIFGGAFRDDSFKISLDLAEHLYLKRVMHKTVVISGSDAQSFLYGRSVRVSHKHGLPTGKLLVLSEQGYALGLGRLAEGSDLLENLIDKGWYLRRGG